MTPKEYYYKIFPLNLNELLKKVTLGGDGHFHIIELFFDKNKKTDTLGHIPKERLSYFLSALAGTILIDQVMFTYFKEDYEIFKKMTLYPKITWSIGWCSNIKPWQLFEHRIVLARGLGNPEKNKLFSEFMQFFANDLIEFFSENKFEKANWNLVKKAMLNDSDIVSAKYGDGDYGEIFKGILESTH